MQLTELEEILRPNFVWDEKPGRKWYVADTDKLGHQSAALIVFCGAAWTCGFKDSDVYDYLDIEKHKHFAYLSRFRNAIRQYQASTMYELYNMDDTSLEGKVMKKYRIVENALKLKANGKFLSLSAIEF
jgi:hypothetical protein